MSRITKRPLELHMKNITSNILYTFVMHHQTLNTYVIIILLNLKQIINYCLNMSFYFKPVNNNKPT